MTTPHSFQENGGNGVTRELKVWQGRSFKVAVVVGIIAIAGTALALADKFLFTQNEGDTLRSDFEHHVEWGAGKYQEIQGHFDRIEETQRREEDKLDLIIENQQLMALDMGVHLKPRRKP